MKIRVPQEYFKIWEKAEKILTRGRIGDTVHCKQTAELVFNYVKQNKKGDPDILIPVAMMHDIGHAAILQQHMKYVTGPKKLSGSKLVHMLAGAKIADDILKQVRYPINKRKEVVEIISMHDFDQIKGTNLDKTYNTLNKKLFHDLDSLDRFSKTRFETVMKIYHCGPDEAIKILLRETRFFLPEIEEEAKKLLQKLKR